jgi:hypothetical protein
MSARTTRIMVIAMLLTPTIILFISFATPAMIRLATPFFCNDGYWLDGGMTNDDFRDADGRSLPNGFYCTDGEHFINMSNMVGGVIAISIVLPYVILIVFALSDFFSHRRMMRTGETGVGSIQSTRATGLTINNQPVYELTLRVYSHAHPPFETTVRSRIDPFFAARSAVPVRFDPVSKRAIIARNESVDESLLKRANIPDPLSGVPVQPSSADTLKEKLEQLKEAYDAGLITSAEYEERRQHFIKSL